jgi:hypothetical protein
MRFKFFTIFAVCTLLLVSFGMTAHAQSRAPFDNKVSLFTLDVLGQDIVNFEKRAGMESLRKKAELYLGPTEPDFPKVKFVTFDAPYHLQGRAESLVHGITIGLPPEYDHYGYEIRRYMQSVGNFQIYTDPAYLQEQLKRVYKAQVVYKYWKEKMINDIAQLEEDVQRENASSKTRSTLKLNASMVSSFMTELENWLRANQDFLEFLVRTNGLYKLEESTLAFKDPADRAFFVTLYGARKNARQHIVKYLPFRAMVY